MTQLKDVVVRLAALDGVWEVGGVDRKRGIAVEPSMASADEWGPLEASFDLRRDPRAVWPDLGPFTPVEIEVAGVKVWSGFIDDAPSTWGAERVINVKCHGWQFHLDDDQYEKVYVHNKLSDYRDMRSFLNVVLGAGRALAAGLVSNDRGAITLSLPQSTAAYAAGAFVGVILDLGPSSTAKRIVVDWASSNNTPLIQLYARGSNDADPGAWASYEDAFSFNNNVGASGTTAGSFATARRYVHLFLSVGTAIAPGADVWFQIKGVRVFADTAYESGGASVLTSPTLIKDALNQATALLSSDQSQIDPSGQATVALPSFAPSDPQTPREVWAAANGLYDWVSQIDVDRRPVFKPKPTSPIFEVGDYSPFEFGDGGNSGSEIYNRVIVTGTTPDGAQIRADRAAGQQTGAAIQALSTPALSNPSFDVDTSGWVAAFGTITRTTTIFDSAPASGVISGGGDVSAAFTGTFRKGVTYVLTFWVSSVASAGTFWAQFGNIAGNDFTLQSLVSPAGGGGLQMVWMPKADTAAGSIRFFLPTPGIEIDTFRLSKAVPTLVDRRGFRRTKRLPVSIPLPADGVLAQRIADTWLGGHNLTPFKGDTTIVGDQAVRNILTGDTLPLERLLLHTQELIRFNDRVDPDTGGQGRDGRLTKVEYDFKANSAKVTIDNTRTSFESLLGRLAAIVTG